MKNFLEGFGIITIFIGMGAGDSPCIWVAPIIMGIGILAYVISTKLEG